jgi:hypothetical protein
LCCVLCTGTLLFRWKETGAGDAESTGFYLLPGLLKTADILRWPVFVSCSVNTQLYLSDIWLYRAKISGVSSIFLNMPLNIGFNPIYRLEYD